jgi:hypothetical protein
VFRLCKRDRINPPVTRVQLRKVLTNLTEQVKSRNIAPLPVSALLNELILGNYQHNAFTLFLREKIETRPDMFTNTIIDNVMQAIYHEPQNATPQDRYLCSLILMKRVQYICDKGVNFASKILTNVAVARLQFQLPDFSVSMEMIRLIDFVYVGSN